MVKYTTRAITTYDSLRNTYNKQIFIVKYNSNNSSFILPSPLTHFVVKYGRSYNTQKKYSEVLCNFINYINEKVYNHDNQLFSLLEEEGLSGLDYNHLANYINFISNDVNNPVSYKTVFLKQEILFHFYEYLNSAGINKKNSDIIRKIEMINAQHSNSRCRKINPFNECANIIINYPNIMTKKRPILKDLPEEIWQLFVEFAFDTSPNIAFGLLLTICSGIRCGECINLRVKDVKVTRNNRTLYLKIDDHQIELFSNRDINLNNSQVKKNRKKQPVLPLHTYIEEAFEKHKARLIKVYHTTDIKNKALFPNAQGEPMSGDSFGSYFRNLKKNFIDFLYNEGLGEKAEHIKYYKWGTHIGRHIYTNAIIKNGFVNGSGSHPISKLVAILRGDSCEESSNTYIDEITIRDAVSKNINDLSKIAMEYSTYDNE